MSARWPGLARALHRRNIDGVRRFGSYRAQYADSKHCRNALSRLTKTPASSCLKVLSASSGGNHGYEDLRQSDVAGVALALPRFRGGKKVPPQFLRMQAEDLIAAVFPDQIACAENLVGEREVPDHPLTN